MWSQECAIGPSGRRLVTQIPLGTGEETIEARRSKSLNRERLLFSKAAVQTPECRDSERLVSARSGRFEAASSMIHHDHPSRPRVEINRDYAAQKSAA